VSAPEGPESSDVMEVTNIELAPPIEGIQFLEFSLIEDAEKHGLTPIKDMPVGKSYVFDINTVPNEEITIGELGTRSLPRVGRDGPCDRCRYEIQTCPHVSKINLPDEDKQRGFDEEKDE